MEKTLVQKKVSLHDTDSLLDRRLLIFDLPTLVKKIKHEHSWENGQRNAITLLKSDNMRLVLIALRSGAEIDFLQSDNLISLQLLNGKLKFQAEENTIILEQGQLLTLRENIPHGLKAINESIFLLTIGNGNTFAE